MSERTQWKTVRQALRGLHPIRVENPALPGTPDVNFIEGWIELKWRRTWPARSDTVVEFDHFTPRQRAWLTERAHNGGRVWVLVQIARDWLLFDGAVGAAFVGRAAREDLEKAAEKVWRNGLDKAELRAILVRPAS